MIDMSINLMDLMMKEGSLLRHNRASIMYVSEEVNPLRYIYYLTCSIHKKNQYPAKLGAMTSIRAHLELTEFREGICAVHFELDEPYGELGKYKFNV